MTQPSNKALLTAHRRVGTTSPYAFAVVPEEKQGYFVVRLADVSSGNPEGIRLVKQVPGIGLSELQDAFRELTKLTEESRRLGLPPVFLDSEAEGGKRRWTFVRSEDLAPRLIGEEQVFVEYRPG